jgi:hypothetical protein
VPKVSAKAVPTFTLQGEATATASVAVVGPGTAWPDGVELLNLRCNPEQGEGVAFSIRD